ncbi:MAG: hypothetical protein GC206_16335 [Alphaproteobacteria bacterium]|nr:hypothetical protein [Alphaproteobacteria bacterium]
MLRTGAAIFGAGAMLVGLSLAAEAQRPEAPPPMERAAVAISRDHAVDIAREQGLQRLAEIDLSAGAWRIRGDAANGRGILIDVSAQTGGVRVVEFDAAPS